MHIQHTEDESQTAREIMALCESAMGMHLAMGLYSPDSIALAVEADPDFARRALRRSTSDWSRGRIEQAQAIAASRAALRAIAMVNAC